MAYATIRVETRSIDAAFAPEDRQQAMPTAIEDHREAMTAFVEKRAPVYHGR